MAVRPRISHLNGLSCAREAQQFTSCQFAGSWGPPSRSMKGPPVRSSDAFFAASWGHPGPCFRWVMGPLGASGLKWSNRWRSGSSR